MGLFGFVKRLARNKLIQAGLNVATGGLSGKVISVGKQLGAVIRGGKVALKQSKSIGPRLAVAGLPPILPADIRPMTPGGKGSPIWAGPLKRLMKGKKPSKRKVKSTGGKVPVAAMKSSAPKLKGSRGKSSQAAIMKAAGVDYRKQGSPGNWKQFLADFRATHNRRSTGGTG